MTNDHDDSAPRDKSELAAIFDSSIDAEAAGDKLKQAGVNNIRVLSGYETDQDGSAPASEGFWFRLGDWLLPDEDRDLYAEGRRRGGVLVSASVDAACYDKAHGLLDEDRST